MFRSAHGEREDGHGRVLPSAARKASSVDYEEILVIVTLRPFVENALPRIVTHAAGTKLVNAVAGWVGNGILRQHLKASSFSQRHSRFDRILRHVVLVVGVL